MPDPGSLTLPVRTAYIGFYIRRHPVPVDTNSEHILAIHRHYLQFLDRLHPANGNDKKRAVVLELFDSSYAY